MSDVKSTVKTFLSRFIPHELGEDEDIFATGHVNSLFAMRLVLYVEEEFNITIPKKELRNENFRTVHAIAQLVERNTVPEKA